MGYYNKTWQDGSTERTNLTFQVMMMSPQQGQVTSINGFISNSIRPITTKLNRMVD